MSNVVIACPICLQKIRAPDNVLGRQIKCPQCKNGFTAVDPRAVAPEPISSPRTRETAEIPAPAPAADPLGLEDDAPFEPASAAPSGGSTIMDYMAFRRMVTPAILAGLFYLGVAVILFLSLVFTVSAIAGTSGHEPTMLVRLITVVIGFVVTISFLVMWRVLCEVILVLFQILDQLREQ